MAARQLPMREGLHYRLGPVLTRRLIDRGEGRRETFRYCFIPIATEPGSVAHFVRGHTTAAAMG
jgi:hypothetical protein